jgi:hypothetical protein
MVSKTLARNKMFGWNLIFECVQEAGDWFIFYYDPNGVDMYKVKLDPTTKNMAKALMANIQAWMNTVDTWSGSIVEHWQKKQVTKPAETVEDWVLV